LLACVLAIGVNVQLSVSPDAIDLRTGSYTFVQTHRLVYRSGARAFQLPRCQAGFPFDGACDRWDGNETEPEWSNFALVL